MRGKVEVGGTDTHFVLHAGGEYMWLSVRELFWEPEGKVFYLVAVSVCKTEIKTAPANKNWQQQQRSMHKYSWIHIFIYKYLHHELDGVKAVFPRSSCENIMQYLFALQ